MSRGAGAGTSLVSDRICTVSDAEEKDDNLLFVGDRLLRSAAAPVGGVSGTAGSAATRGAALGASQRRSEAGQTR